MDATTESIRLLAMMVVFLLLIMLASMHAALKRNSRIERKLDIMLNHLGLAAEGARVDAMGSRYTALATITEGEELDEGSSSRSASHWWRRGSK